MNHNSMPIEVNEVFEALYQKICDLYLKWIVFEQVYGARENVDLLNEAAPLFFRLAQDALLDAILLAIGRLTDPATTGTKSNLSLRGLSATIPDPIFKAEIERSIGTAHVHWEKARDIRNRNIAHTDLDTYMERHPNPLPNVTCDEVTAALKRIAEIMNAVISHYNPDEEIAFDYLITPDDGSQLIATLSFGVRERQEERRGRSAHRKRLIEGSERGM